MIREFQGEYRWLSNFWPEGNVERQFQAAKFIDLELQKKILAAETPGIAKKMTRKYKHLRRKDWHAVSMKVMKHLLKDKFENPLLRRKLLATGDRYLQEGNNWHDDFWGVCLGGCKQGPHEPVGENMLGKLLMEVRAEIRVRAGGLCA